MDERKTIAPSAGWYFLGGIIAGAAAGLLLAPKKGSDMRAQVRDWGRRSRIRTESIAGAAIKGAQVALDGARDEVKEFASS